MKFEIIEEKITYHEIPRFTVIMSDGRIIRLFVNDFDRFLKKCVNGKKTLFRILQSGYRGNYLDVTEKKYFNETIKSAEDFFKFIKNDQISLHFGRMI